MKPEDFHRGSDGQIKRDYNKRPILNSDLLCLSCKIVMSKIASGDRQCTYCGSLEGYSPAEDAWAMEVLMESARGLIKTWFFDKCCKVRMHVYEEIESEDERFRHGTLFGVPIETSVRYRTCTYCGKRQRSEWLTWQDVYDIPPARLMRSDRE